MKTRSWRCKVSAAEISPTSVTGRPRPAAALHHREAARRAAPPVVREAVLTAATLVGGRRVERRRQRVAAVLVRRDPPRFSTPAPRSAASPPPPRPPPTTTAAAAMADGAVDFCCARWRGHGRTPGGGVADLSAARRACTSSACRRPPGACRGRSRRRRAWGWRRRGAAAGRRGTRAEGRRGVDRVRRERRQPHGARPREPRRAGSAGRGSETRVVSYTGFALSRAHSLRSTRARSPTSSRTCPSRRRRTGACRSRTCTSTGRRRSSCSARG